MSCTLTIKSKLHAVTARKFTHIIISCWFRNATWDLKGSFSFSLVHKRIQAERIVVQSIDFFYFHSGLISMVFFSYLFFFFKRIVIFGTRIRNAFKKYMHVILMQFNYMLNWKYNNGFFVWIKIFQLENTFIFPQFSLIYAA